MNNETHNINRIFKDLTNKISDASKRGYSAALSSIESSQKAGKSTVLKMEISARKAKMKKLFAQLGERAFELKAENTFDLFQDATISEIIRNLNIFADEITEIENYIIVPEESETIINPNNRISDIPPTREVPNKPVKRKKIKKNSTLSEPKENPKPINENIKTETKDPLSTLKAQLKNKDKDIRIQAIKHIFRSEDQTLTPYLTYALKDDEPEIRRRATSYLGWKMVTSAIPSLIKQALEDKSKSVVIASYEALGELNEKEAIPTMIKGLDNKDLEIRKSAYTSLRKVSNEFIAFNPNGTLSERFKSIQKWEKWWENQNK